VFEAWYDPHDPVSSQNRALGHAQAIPHFTRVDPMTSDPPSSKADPAMSTAATGNADPRTGGDSPRVVNSDALLAGASQLAILHNQTIYFLRQTRFGKLILTK
jgi:hemin uptake protein HemP